MVHVLLPCLAVSPRIVRGDELVAQKRVESVQARLHAAQERLRGASLTPEDLAHAKQVRDQVMWLQSFDFGWYPRTQSLCNMCLRSLTCACLSISSMDSEEDRKSIHETLFGFHAFSHGKGIFVVLRL